MRKGVVVVDMEKNAANKKQYQNKKRTEKEQTAFPGGS
jgi:hypothetical protein